MVVPNFSKTIVQEGKKICVNKGLGWFQKEFNLCLGKAATDAPKNRLFIDENKKVFIKFLIPGSTTEAKLMLPL